MLHAGQAHIHTFRVVPSLPEALQPLEDTTDIVAVIKGVIEAENGAIAQYNKIIQVTDGRDYVSQDLAIQLLSGEEEHRREFIGFLKEYEK